MHQRLSPVVRETLSFSKKLENHIGSMCYFIHYYKAYLSIELKLESREDVTTLHLSSETVLATFTAHGYSMCFLCHYRTSDRFVFVSTRNRNIVYPSPFVFVQNFVNPVKEFGCFLFPDLNHVLSGLFVVAMSM